MIVFIVICTGCLVKRASVRDERQQQTENLLDDTGHCIEGVNGRSGIILNDGRGKLSGKLYVKVTMSNA